MPKAFRADPDHPAVAYLARLHADLGGKIKDNRKEAARLADAMKHVEAVIQLFDPAYNLRRISARRRYGSNPWFRRGECFRSALDVLRAAEGSLTSREIASRMLARKGVPEPTLKQLRDVIGAVHRSLRNGQGKTVIAHDETMPVRWALVT